RRARRPSCNAAARGPIAPAATVRTVGAGAIVRRAASVRALAMTWVPPFREKKNECATSSFHTPPQELPVLRRQRAQDRLQGRAAAPALHLRARQDRAEPNFGGV